MLELEYPFMSSISGHTRLQPHYMEIWNTLGENQ